MTMSVVGASEVTITWGEDLVANVGMFTESGSYEPKYAMSVSLDGVDIPALSTGPESK